MMPPSVTWICIFVVVFIPTALGMNCVQCNSTLDHNCQEKFDESPNNPMKSTPCTIWHARFCIKVTGLYGGIVGTHRFCTSRDLGNQCQDISYPNHDRMYRACVYTCDSDDCNSATTIWSVQRLVMIAVVAILTILSTTCSWL